MEPIKLSVILNWSAYSLSLVGPIKLSVILNWSAYSLSLVGPIKLSVILNWSAYSPVSGVAHKTICYPKLVCLFSCLVGPIKLSVILNWSAYLLSLVGPIKISVILNWSAYSPVSGLVYKTICSPRSISCPPDGCSVDGFIPEKSCGGEKTWTNLPHCSYTLILSFIFSHFF
jgi:hypothetical protein